MWIHASTHHSGVSRTPLTETHCLRMRDASPNFNRSAPPTSAPMRTPSVQMWLHQSMQPCTSKHPSLNESGSSHVHACGKRGGEHIMHASYSLVRVCKVTVLQLAKLSFKSSTTQAIRNQPTMSASACYTEKSNHIKLDSPVLPASCSARMMTHHTIAPQALPQRQPHSRTCATKLKFEF